MTSRIQFFKRGDPALRECYARYPDHTQRVEYWPDVQAGNDRNGFLRDLLISARREGLAFRFWSAAEVDGKTGLHITFNDEQACDAFDQHLLRKETELRAAAPIV